MKKVAIFAMLLSLTLTGAAFAADAVDADSPLLASDTETGMTLNANSPVGAIIGKTSKGVRIGAQFNSTAFAFITMHINGSKYYGSAFDSTAIMVKSPEGDINAAFEAPATSVGATAFTSAENWSAL